jgi:hypothetical protein
MNTTGSFTAHWTTADGARRTAPGTTVRHALGAAFGPADLPALPPAQRSVAVRSLPRRDPAARYYHGAVPSAA